MDQLSKTARFVFLSWPSALIAVTWLWMFSQTDHGAQLYGEIAPVTSPLQVTSVETAIVNGVRGSRIRGEADIKRASCDYLNVEFDLHGDHKSVAVSAFFQDDAQVRGAGRHQWEALMVGIPPEQLRNSTGDVKHQCGLFPVMTPFYRPDESVSPYDAGATAICHSGAYTTSTGNGTCSGHGGVDQWLTQEE